MNPANDIHNKHHYLVNSTMYCSFIASLLMLPFCIIQITEKNYVLAGIMMFFMVGAGLNANACRKGKYSPYINIFFLVPVLTLGLVFGMYKIGLAAAFWPFLALILLYFILHQKQAFIIGVIYICMLTPVAFYIFEPKIAARYVAVLVGIKIFTLLALRELLLLNERLHLRSLTDPLTSLFNRYSLQASLENVIHIHNRTINAEKTAIIMIDIDHFKSINDDFGHQIGDHVIQRIAKFLQDSVPNEKIFRMGGEEFLILLTDEATSAENLAETLRENIEHADIVNGKTVTASFGVAQYKKGMNWAEWIAAADQQLYHSKEKGRNLVSVA